ncbi:hypothetical protein FRB90_007433 [Tulasnella sp. 427]|nr:hypothetical protein FRB90_007433 [Tulasnella sp. 427]
MYQSLPRIPSKARPTLGMSGQGSTSQLDSLEATAADTAAPTITAESSEEEIQKAYEEWATNARFEYCDLSIQPSAAVQEARQRRIDEIAANHPTLQLTPDDAPSYMSAYNQEARMLTHSDIPKRNLAIAKELAVLTTNLPVAWNSSIFLRVDETRVDIIKALITGPEGTPYHNGCYLFDIFLGSSYNTAPPSVKYMTTNGGKFRFNPNLYAMLGNLKNPPEPFKDIILTHFRLKAKSIKAQLDDWLTKDDGRALAPLGSGYVTSNSGNANGNGGSGTGFRRDVEELKSLLDGLMRGEDPTVQPSSSGSAIPTPSATGTPSETGV